MSWKVTNVVRPEIWYLEFLGELEGHKCCETREMLP